MLISNLFKKQSSEASLVQYNHFRVKAFYSLALVLIKHSDEIGEKQLSSLGFRGGQISHLMLLVELSLYQC